MRILNGYRIGWLRLVIIIISRLRGVASGRVIASVRRREASGRIRSTSNFRLYIYIY